MSAIGSLQCIVLDCPVPRELAEFYAALTGGEVDRPDPRWGLDEDWSTVHLPSGMVLCFQRVGAYRPPQWPDPERPAQFHLDVEVTDLEEAERASLALGAKTLDAGDGKRSWRVYADPAGHPFCLVRH